MTDVMNILQASDLIKILCFFIENHEYLSQEPQSRTKNLGR